MGLANVAILTLISRLVNFHKFCNSCNTIFSYSVCNLGRRPLPFVWECPAIESQSVWRMCNIYRSKYAFNTLQYTFIQCKYNIYSVNNIDKICFKYTSIQFNTKHTLWCKELQYAFQYDTNTCNRFLFCNIVNNNTL